MLNNETLQTIFNRASIRRYTDEPLDSEVIDTIVEAGLRAPSAGGCQAPALVTCTDREINKELGRISKSLYNEGNYPVSTAQPSTADVNAPESAFYGAPVVVSVLTPKGWSYAPYDAAMASYAMMLAAWSLGIGSCYVSRAKETLSTPEGLRFLKDAGAPEGYEGACHVVFGHPQSWEKSPKPLLRERDIRILQKHPMG